MKINKFISFILTATFLLTIFVIPASAEDEGGDQLTNSSTLSANSILVNDSIVMYGVGSGGTEPYEYGYYYKSTSDPTWHVVRSYSSNNSATLTLSTADTYDLCIKVRDANNTVAKKYFVATVSNGAIVSKSYLSSENIVLEDTVILYGVGTGGTAPYTYAFYVKDENISNWTCLHGFSSISNVEFTPEAIGTYDVCIKVHDSLNAEHKKYFKLHVNDSVNANVCYISSSKIDIGESVTMCGIGIDGISPYRYAFYAKFSDSTQWTTVQDFSDTNTATFTPSEIGIYDLCIKVKDANDQVAEKYFTVEAEPPGITVYFYNYHHWNNVRVYYYNDDNGVAETWPGVNMVDEGDGWYSKRLAYYDDARVIFNDGSYNQISNGLDDGFEVTQDSWYRNGTWTNSRPDEITVYFYKPNDWSAPNIYYFLNNNDAGTSWPGVPMEEVSDGWYSYHITKYSSAKVMFNDGTHQITGSNNAGLDVEGIMWYKNGVWCDSETDTDEDGLLDCQELVLGTNLNLTDTDGDHLPDGYEILTLDTDPTQTDSDNNNVTDDNEDFDNDGLTNLQEYQNNTNPFSEDTDGDTLSDSDEITATPYQTDPTDEDTDHDGLDDAYEIAANPYQTNPTLADTDNDGADDGWEIEHGSNPSIPDSNFSISTQLEDPANQTVLTAAVSGGAVPSMNIEFVEDNTLINNSIPGYLAQAVDITSSETNISNTKLSFTFDESFVDSNFDPVICYFNEDTQTFEALETTVVDYTASATLTHCSLYALFNRHYMQDLFDVIDANNTSRWFTDAKPVNMDTMHVAIVTDCSANTDSNTINKTSQLLQLITGSLGSVNNINYEATLITNNNTATNFSNTASDFASYISTSSLSTGAGVSLSTGINTALDKLNSCDNAYTDLMVVISTGNIISNVNYNDYYRPLEQKIKNQHTKFIVLKINNDGNQDMPLYLANLKGNCYDSQLQDDRCYTNTWYEWYIGNTTVSQTDVNNVKSMLNSYFMQDENEDGIIDYYTALFCNSEDSDKQIRYTSGAEILIDSVIGRVSYNDFQAGGHDYDNDGKDNGEELTIFKGADGKFKATRTSDMLNPDTDGDGILDGNDTAPTEKGMANGIVGQLSIVSEVDKNCRDFTCGHAFLVYKSYVDDFLDINGFYAGYLQRPDGEYEFYPPNELNNHFLPLKSNQVVSFGNFADMTAYSDYQQGWNTIMSRIGVHIGINQDDMNNFIIGRRSLRLLINNVPGGVHYNKEMFEVQRSSDFSPNIALTREITDAQLHQIIDLHKTYNYYNLITNNCVKVAGRAWNIVFGDNLNYSAGTIHSPLILRVSIEDRKTNPQYHVTENLNILNPT